MAGASLGLVTISMRWKLQLGFLAVISLTILANRWAGYGELQALIHAIQQQQASPSLIAELEQRLDVYIWNSIWQSAIKLVVLSIAIYVLAGFLVRPILDLCEALDKVEHGDLTQDVKITSQDEVGILEKRFNDMRRHLSDIVRNLDRNTRQMINSAYQVSAISHEISEVEQREQTRAGEVMAATDELHDTLDSVHNQALQASEAATSMEHTARETIKGVADNIAAMKTMVDEVDRAAQQTKELNESAGQIVAVVNSIHSIAEQTNLLALNAAIEAARAGQQGRGFAVVADEVRNLANRTTQATDEIANIIDQLCGNVTRVSETMGMVVDRVDQTQADSRQVAGVIEDMANRVCQSAETAINIANVSSEQTQRLQVLRQSLQRLFEINRENHTKVENTTGIADDLYHVAGNLQRVLSGFVYEKKEESQTFQGRDSRRAPRTGHRLRVQVTQGDVMHGGTCMDFSVTGMKLKLLEALDSERNIQMEVFVPHDDYREYGQQEPLRIEGRVVWQQVQGDYMLHGIEYLAISRQQQDILRRSVEYFDSSTVT